MYFYSYPIHTTISIRAPARGATMSCCTVRKDIDISIRAPARGATLEPSRLHVPSRFQSALPRGERLGSDCRRTTSTHFNPRSREGSDPPENGARREGQISIRAPARGATRRSQTCDGADAQFQSALPRGERHVYVTELLDGQVFQSALPRGERQQFSPKSSLLS